MAIEVRLTKKEGRFVPSDHLSLEEMQSIAEGEYFTATIRRSRNIGHHRKFFAFLNIVYEAQDKFSTPELLLDAIKIGIGHCDWHKIKTGRHVLDYAVPSSISFSSMDQRQFEQFYNKAIAWVIGKDGPLSGTGKQDLEQQITDFLGEA